MQVSKILDHSHQLDIVKHIKDFIFAYIRKHFRDEGGLPRDHVVCRSFHHSVSENVEQILSRQRNTYTEGVVNIPIFVPQMILQVRVVIGAYIFARQEPFSAFFIAQMKCVDITRLNVSSISFLIDTAFCARCRLRDCDVIGLCRALAKVSYLEKNMNARVFSEGGMVDQLMLARQHVSVCYKKIK